MKRNDLSILPLIFSTVACMALAACNQRNNETPTSTTPSPAAVSPTADTPAGAMPGSSPTAGTAATKDTAASLSPSDAGKSDADKALSDADKQFFTAAAQSGYAEIAASRMAKERSSSDLVKNFADMMIADHTAVGNDLKSLAGKKGVQLPEDDAGKYKSDLDALGKLKGVAFDRAYAQRVGVAAHKDAVSLFQKTGDSAFDSDVKTFANTNLPALKRHLEMARSLPTV